MSSAAQSGPSAPKEKKGVGRVLTRMKTMMKKAEKRMSLSGPSKPTTSAAAPAAEPSPAEVPAAVPEAPVTAPVATESKDKKPEAAAPVPTRVSRIQLQEERARKLGERFGLEIKPNEWHSTAGDALRVNKPIRMRIHRVCHECKTEFGTSKVCPNCKHIRCKKCPRYPPKRTEAEKIASRERRAQIIKEQKENAPILPDWNPSHKPIVLTIPSKTGGRDLVYKKPRQRLRRTCCQCGKLFISGNKKCPGCEHARCTDCPRDPAKKNKYPFGYPGDEFGPKSIARYKCLACKTLYPADSLDGTECAKCGHAKGPDSPRQLPRRVEPEPDPEVLKSIEIRMSKLKVG